MKQETNVTKIMRNIFHQAPIVSPILITPQEKVMNSAALPKPSILIKNFHKTLSLLYYRIGNSWVYSLVRASAETSALELEQGSGNAGLQKTDK